jgi:hypothetical protein
MELAFNVNAGPLAQIGIQILTLDTAVQLAIGAYGWYKARERSHSLTQLLSARGGSLISTSSFNKDVYNRNRQHQGQVLGIIVQNGAVVSTELPKASTAINEHAGQACLRALSTGILCFYNVDATTSILSELIPFALLQLEQEDAVVNMEGPLFNGLKQYVSAIAVEEDSSTYRTHLLHVASNHQAQFTSVALNEILACDSTEVIESHLVIGCLKWMLTPLHKRDFLQYPTRSLRVWALASIMGQLGFEIAASAEVVTTKEDYSRATNVNQYVAGFPEVVLVTANIGETDYFASSEVPASSEFDLRPQIIAVRAIPWLAFRHLRGSNRRVNSQYLVDVWTYTYNYVCANVDINCTDPPGHIRLLPRPGSNVIFDHHASLLRIFSPHLAKVCGPPMKNFVPDRVEGDSWSPDRIEEQFRILRTQEDDFQPDPVLRDNCYILIAIVLGTIYGIVSKFCVDNNREFNLDAEVAFTPDIVYRKRLKDWATFISLPLTAPPSYKDWNLCVLELVLGHRATDLNGWYAAGTSEPSLSGANGIGSGHRLPIGTILGAQANGMAAVLDIVVNPSLEPEAVAIFHVRHGQMLSLPVSGHGYIEASQRQEPGIVMELDPEPDIRTLEIKGPSSTSSPMRIDVEPCWEGDPQTVVFRCRYAGTLLCPVNITTVISRLQQNSVPCTCRQPTLTLPVPSSERWHSLVIENFARRIFNSMSRRRVDLSSDPKGKVVVDASQSESATLYAIGAIQCQDVLVCKGCLKCVKKRIEERWRKGSIVVILAASCSGSVVEMISELLVPSGTPGKAI